MNLEALLEPSPSDHKPCKLGRIIEGLEEPYRSALETLLEVQFADGGESDRQLAVRLAKAGFKVSQPVVYRHRNGGCACESVVVE